ncbi:SRPBCC family protein [Chromobacterium sp. IIBBL 290-4]|uniref:SRPBCC family protein n=1 Tax=Chromobacterium sp. IIBBL 290-4 TaxID=2953890 RepID=UPI0020B78F53|nr:SRPBCC family protein [Chromobacterium sp. IIBBL 290-4]UTH74671.1 SRPBCC family protein [Chromobacterium sp. IIBBL 290-4]
MPNTIRLHRVLRAQPERVYRAFLDPLALAKWLPPEGFVCRVLEHDARVGGGYKMEFLAFASGQVHAFGGRYLELETAARIRYSDRFEDAGLPGEMMTTIVLQALDCGVDVSITQEGIPDAIPPENCYLGWQQSLNQLARLVEADAGA